MLSRDVQNSATFLKENNPLCGKEMPRTLSPGPDFG
jgi:hypothetical protein